MKVNCSNCMTVLDLNISAGTITHETTAQGRASKRVYAQTIINDVIVDGVLAMWDAPCCEDYADSFEVTA